MNKFFTIAVSALVLASSVPAFAQATGSMPSCAPGDPVVWENSSSKVYHMQGDSYYGKTKKGGYACKSAADAAGYHASGSKSSMKSSTPVPTPSPMATSKSKHHKHSKSSASPEPGGAGASPNAGSVPTPAST